MVTERTVQRQDEQRKQTQRSCNWQQNTVGLWRVSIWMSCLLHGRCVAVLLVNLCVCDGSHLPTRSVSNHHNLQLPVLAVLLRVRHGAETYPDFICGKPKRWEMVTGMLSPSYRANHRWIKRQWSGQADAILTPVTPLLYSAWSTHTLLPPPTPILRLKTSLTATKN